VIEVLVVDDDEDIRLAVADVLDLYSFRAVTAANGHEALEWLRGAARLPSLILLDLMMPVMDGHAFLAELRRDPRLSAIPVVVFTAYGKVPADLSAVPAQAFVSKPLGAAQLVDLVERFATAGQTST
jgi:CheY-like chemotaxis protein